jgi:alpha-glucosidase
MNGEHSRTPMPWDEPHRVVQDLRSLYSGLGALRREPVLRTGSLRWLHADADTLAFVRELEGSIALVVAARDEADVVLPAGLLPQDAGADTDAALAVGRLSLTADGAGGVRLRAAGPAAAVWLLP